MPASPKQEYQEAQEDSRGDSKVEKEVVLLGDSDGRSLGELRTGFLAGWRGVEIRHGLTRLVRRPSRRLLLCCTKKKERLACFVGVLGRNGPTYLMFWGGSIEGTNSRTAYARPIIPIIDPNTISKVCTSRRMDPTKM
jgi:hypothetical protein